MLQNTARQILVVEDEALIRMLAVDMLNTLGFEPLEAETGEEAITLAGAHLHQLSALMIDLGLPDQPGEEVIRQILALRPDLPVFVTTGSDPAAAASRLRGQGHISVLGKPYEYNDLKRVMASLTTTA